MPLPIIPRRIFAHRVACKALYRALLLQVPRIPISHDVKALELGPVNPLRHLIRKGFKSNVHVTSKEKCVRALERGYVAEELLRKAGDGDTMSIGQVQALLLATTKRKLLARQTHQHHLTLNPPPPRKPRLLVAPFPSAPKTLSIRPLPFSQLSGKRRIPVLTAANYIPFLRFKKPQSPFLSRVFRDKIKQKQRRFTGIERCEEGAEMGGAEGEWESRIVGQAERELGALKGKGEREKLGRWLQEGEGKDFERGNGNGERSEWATEATRARYGIHEFVGREMGRVNRLGKELLGLVEKEREMWELERLQRRDRKKGRVVREELPQKMEERGSMKERTGRDQQTPNLNAGRSKRAPGPRATF